MMISDWFAYDNACPNNLWEGATPVEKINLGSIYFGEKTVRIGSRWDKTPIMIGDTDPENPITWIKASDSLLVADRVVCTAISWKDLRAADYIFGKPIMIDGRPYLCRAPKVGGPGYRSEMDPIIARFGEDNEIWHWKGKYYWGQERSCYSYRLRMISGYTSARNVIEADSDIANTSIGYRPILEVLPVDMSVDNSMIGKRIEAYGPVGKILGTLIAFSEYDLFLACNDCYIGTPSNTWYAKSPDGSIAIDRTSVLQIIESVVIPLALAMGI